MSENKDKNKDKDPLHLLKELSGVNALCILEKDDKRIVVLGDVHTNTSDKECQKCVKDCFTVSRLIHKLKEYHKKNGTELDVYAEFLAPSFDRKDKTRMEMFVDVEQNLKVPNDIMLLQLRKEFAADAYAHKATKTRIHYVDVRTLPFLNTLGIMVFVWYASHNPLKEKVRIDACTKNYFHLFQLIYPTAKKFDKVIHDILLEMDDPDNYIYKQYKKLSSNDQALMRKFAKKSFQHVKTMFDFDKNPEEYFLFMTGILLEFYALCRFLRFFKKQPAGSTSVFLAGVLHTANFKQFLEEWGCETVVDQHPTLSEVVKFTEQVSMGKKDNKCLHVKT
jgi:hypothetical protein